MQKPNLFIVGAPKCGTTALYSYLSEHPNIYFCPRKEPQYFGADFAKRPLNSYQHIANEQSYLALFSEAKDQAYLGEASTSYFYSKSAAYEIYQFNPSAKIIIMLRDPVEMMYSLYYQQLELGIEDMPSFEEGLAAEVTRLAGEGLSKQVYIPESLCYRYIATFSQHVKRYLDIFGRENVHIIIYEDFKADTSQVYKETLKFLALEDNEYQQFAVVNANSRPRNQWLRDFLANPPQPLLKLGRSSLPLARPLYRWLRRLNTEKSIRPAINAQTKQQLCWALKPEIDKLEELLGHDLSHWCHQASEN